MSRRVRRALAPAVVVVALAARGAFGEPPPGATPTPTPTPVPEAAAGEGEKVEGPERLKKEVRVTVEEAPPADERAPAAPAEKPKRTKLEFSWRGWDGLHMALTQQLFVAPASTGAESGEVKPGPAHIIRVEQVKLAGVIGGRLEVDAAGYVTSGNVTGFDGGVELRRLLLKLGGDCILLVPFTYYIELGYVPSTFVLNEAWLAFPNIKYVGTLKAGQFGPPMGLGLLTSSLAIPLMEPAAPLQAIVPPTQAGLQIGKPGFGTRGTWALGLFGNGAGSVEYGNASTGYGNAIGRATYLVIDRMKPGLPPENRYLHVGLGLNYQFSSTGVVRYKARPESYLAPYVVDTGDIEATALSTIDLEGAWVNGPLSVQGEYIHSWVRANDGTSLHFGGFYAMASWFLTGESRPYNRTDAKFARIVPRRNFAFGKGRGRGALEVSARYSFTDLNSKNVLGGKLSMLMAGATWTLHPHIRWLFNAGYGFVRGSAEYGRFGIFQTRVGVDF